MSKRQSMDERVKAAQERFLAIVETGAIVNDMLRGLERRSSELDLMLVRAQELAQDLYAEHRRGRIAYLFTLGVGMVFGGLLTLTLQRFGYLVLP